MQFRFRSYQCEDKPRLLEILSSNTPKYFNHGEGQYFIDFLDNYADENYLVVISGEKIIGCGGHYTKENMHGIAWVMFERGSVGSGQLLTVAHKFYSEMENRILEEGKNYPVLINTTQLMENLFNSYGFETYEIVTNGFGEGLDEYKMRKILTNET